MKTCIFILAFVVASAIGQSKTAIETQFENFMSNYKKKYSAKPEYTLRFNVFQNNMNLVAKHNKRYDEGLVDFKIGLNEFSDTLNTEFVKKMNGYKQMTPNDTVVYNAFAQQSMSAPQLKGTAVPTTKDWRTSNCVSQVYNQGSCGSCYTFSAAGAMEGACCIKTGTLTPLSQQNLLDCTYTSTYLNLGCGGGQMWRCFQYAYDNKGIDSLTSYPYTGVYSGKCGYKSANKAATPTGWVIVNATESALQVAVAFGGPVSVAVDASHYSFQQYASGIYSEPACSSTQLDHAVLVVGYSNEIVNGRNQAYWIIKNSWGTSWGIGGYMKMARNANNMCGIASSASYPLC